MEQTDAEALFVSGTIAAGKTAVAGAAAGLLGDAGIPNAVIDLDWLCQAFPAPAVDPFHNELAFTNLTSIWPNYATLGIERLVVARVIESPRWRARAAASLPGVRISVARITASLETRRGRIVAREIDPRWRDRFLDRTVELEQTLDEQRIEDAVFDNDGATPREVARTLLEWAGWLAERPGPSGIRPESA